MKTYALFAMSILLLSVGIAFMVKYLVFDAFVFLADSVHLLLLSSLGFWYLYKIK